MTLTRHGFPTTPNIGDRWSHQGYWHTYRYSLFGGGHCWIREGADGAPAGVRVWIPDAVATPQYDY